MNTSFQQNPSPCDPLEVYYDKSFHSHNQDYIITAFTIVNSIIATTATVSNLTIIITFLKTPSLLTPSNFLILCLSISDLSVGLFCQPFYCIFRYTQTKWNIPVMCFSFKAFSATVWFLTSASFLILLVITTDRFLALKLHLRYTEFVTTTRYCFALVMIIIFSVTASVSRMLGSKIWELAMAVVFFMITCVIIGVYFMFEISKAIRRHSRQIQAQEQSTQANINMPRYKKSVNTMYYVIGAFVLCYLPFIINLVVTIVFYRKTLKLLYANIASETLVMANGVVNPVIYCWRVSGIRRAVRNVLHSNVSGQPSSTQ